PRIHTGFGRNVAPGRFLLKGRLPAAAAWRMIQQSGLSRERTGATPAPGIERILAIPLNAPVITGRDMLRKRLASLAVAAGLGLSLGCSSTNTACGTRTGFFSRLCGRCKNRGTVAEAGPVIDTGAVFAPPCCDDGSLV